MAKKFIIFDMDGTLTATAKATGLAIDRVRKKFDLPNITDEDIRAAMGLGGLEFHEKLFPEKNKDILIRIANEVEKWEEKNIKMIGRDILFPGVREMLLGLRERGCPLFIASTGSLRHVRNTLRTSGIMRLFTEIHCDEPQKVGMVKKIIANRDPDEFIMVGDMFKDAEAARGNGIFALGAGYGYLDIHDRDLFDAVIDKPGDIFPLLFGPV
jgi:phosphoglycolate phosphatase